MLPQSDTEAYLWARKAAEAGLVEAMYAVGYFLEVGIGTEPNTHECVLLTFRDFDILVLCSLEPVRAMQWYKRAADLGDRRAAQRLKGSSAPAAPGGPGSVLHRDSNSDGMSASGSGKNGRDKECVIM